MNVKAVFVLGALSLFSQVSAAKGSSYAEVGGEDVSVRQPARPCFVKVGSPNVYLNANAVQEIHVEESGVVRFVLGYRHRDIRPSKEVPAEMVIGRFFDEAAKCR